MSSGKNHSLAVVSMVGNSTVESTSSSVEYVVRLGTLAGSIGYCKGGSSGVTLRRIIV